MAGTKLTVREQILTVTLLSFNHFRVYFYVYFFHSRGACRGFFELLPGACALLYSGMNDYPIVPSICYFLLVDIQEKGFGTAKMLNGSLLRTQNTHTLTYVSTLTHTRTHTRKHTCTPSHKIIMRGIQRGNSSDLKRFASPVALLLYPQIFKNQQ